MTTKDTPKKRGTKAEIARWLEVSERTITDYIGRLDLKPDAQKRYAVLSCFQEHERRQKADPRQQDYGDDIPPVRSWSDVQKRTQVEKLRIQIDELRGELVPIDEVRGVLAEHAAAVKGALDNFVQHVAAGKRDAEILAWAEQARDAAMNGIRDAI